jgi:hypothetical protein
MNNQCIRVSLAMTLFAGLPLTSWAQMSQPTLSPSDRVQQTPTTKRPPRTQPHQLLQPDLDETDQFSPRQLTQAPRQFLPGRSSRPIAAAARAVACGGVFAKESTHLKLASAFASKNIVFGEVDGPDGTKLNASILFPNDPKRRLEVLWQNEAARSGTSLIVITAQSGWTAPKGLHLGMPLAALERLNGKSFKLTGFDKDNFAAVTDWQGGVLEKLPGGCKIGIRLSPDPKTSDTARAEVTSDKELQSSDASLRAVSPIIGEIIIGY